MYLEFGQILQILYVTRRDSFVLIDDSEPSRTDGTSGVAVSTMKGAALQELDPVAAAAQEGVIGDNDRVMTRRATPTRPGDGSVEGFALIDSVGSGKYGSIRTLFGAAE